MYVKSMYMSFVAPKPSVMGVPLSSSAWARQ